MKATHHYVTQLSLQTNVQSPFYWLSLFSLFTLFCGGIIHPKVLFKDDIENSGTNKSNISFVWYFYPRKVLFLKVTIYQSIRIVCFCKIFLSNLLTKNLLHCAILHVLKYYLPPLDFQCVTSKFLVWRFCLNWNRK